MDLTTARALRWGRPPVGFLSEHLASALGPGSLPEDMAIAMGLPEPTTTDLTRTGLARLPGDEEVLDRIGNGVIAYVEERMAQLRDVQLVRGTLPARPELAVRSWPARPRNALLRTGLAARPERLQSATVGDLLDTRMVGVQTALEVMALLEASAHIDPEAAVSATMGNSESFLIDKAVLRWGTPPAPLLPETLRRTFGGETLPRWLTNDLGLPSGATTLALDESVWKRIDDMPPRVTQYVIGLITYRGAVIAELTVVGRGWHGGDPTRVEWPPRVRRAAKQAGLLDEKRLGTLTYGELLAVPSLGAKSALEFAVIAEQASSAVSAALSDRQQEALLSGCQEPWAERVRAYDPRFRDIAPAYDGTLAELFDDALANPQGERSLRIADAIDAVRGRVAEIDAQPLDVALRNLLLAERVRERDIEITVRRMGWGGEAPKSLQEIGDACGLTRERVRQIVSRALRRMDGLYLPALERAIQELSNEAPLPADTAAKLLADSGIAAVPFHPAGVERAAEVFGYEAAFQVASQDGVSYVNGPDDPGVGSILRAARREAGKVGASNVVEVRAKLEADGEPFSEEAIRRLLETNPRVRFLVGDWFWIPDIPRDRNRLRNCTRKMLSVAPRLSLASIRPGLRRRYRFRRIDVVPPTDVLRALFAEHPEFTIDRDDVVSCTAELDYRKELGDTERIFVEVLRAIPSGLCDRAELEAAVIGRGVNPSTFAVFTSFSPILDHPATNVWCLRGHDLDPVAVEALRDVVATRPRERRTIGYGWEEDGALAVTTIIGNVNSPVIGIPSAVSRYVAGRRFPATTQDGSHVGMIVVDERGTSWGYGPFLRRRGAEVGDVMTIRFDIATEQASLVLADEIDLDEV